MKEFENTKYLGWKDFCLLSKKSPFEKKFEKITPDKISTDSRKINAGDFFVPIRGDNFDGHAYIEKAVLAGAIGFSCETTSLGSLPQHLKRSFFEVNDNREFLLGLGNTWRLKQRKLKIIALTGSVGKTTVKEMLRSILRDEQAIISPENQNNEIGTAYSLLRLRDDTQYAVFEFGARKLGDIKQLTQAVMPEIACVLNAKSSHLEIFGSLQNIFLGKTEIFSEEKNAKLEVIVYPSDDIRFLNIDSEQRKKHRTFGLAEESDVKILDFKLLGSGEMLVSLYLKNFKKKISFKLPYYHDSFASNSAAAFTLALELGMKPELIAKNIAFFSSTGERFSPLKVGGLILIDDSYNASPESMISGLKSLRINFTNLVPTLVLGDMYELGSESIKRHQEIGKFITEMGPVKTLILVGDLGRHIGEVAIETGFEAAKVFYYKSTAELIQSSNKLFSRGDLVYLKASHALNLSQVATWIKNKFTEK